MTSPGRADDDVDVLVVGAGPAGLASAIYLARFLRRVLVVEDGRSRAARIPCSHNTPAFPDGVAGSELVGRMRAQAERYGARIASGRVTSLALRSNGFAVEWTGGTLAARKVVLATGVDDVPPAMPHLADAVQQGLLRYCPVCDGYEVRDQAVGLIADEGADASEALYLRHFTDRVTVFRVSEAVRFDDARLHDLARAGVVIAPGAIDAIRLDGERVVVAHGDTQTPLDSLYCALGMEVHSGLAVALGAAHDDEGYLVVGEHRETTVPGLYAVGDVARGLNQITVAVGDAAIASAAIHLALMQMQRA